MPLPQPHFEGSIYRVKSLRLEGMKAKKKRTVKMAMGSSNSMKGGGGNGGSINGRMSKDAVRHISSSSDSNPNIYGNISSVNPSFGRSTSQSTYLEQPQIQK